MKLATLLRRSGTAEEPVRDDETTQRSEESLTPEHAAVRREWDLLREGAGSEAERTEIDAVFSRAMP